MRNGPSSTIPSDERSWFQPKIPIWLRSTPDISFGNPGGGVIMRQWTPPGRQSGCLCPSSFSDQQTPAIHKCKVTFSSRRSTHHLGAWDVLLRVGQVDVKSVCTPCNTLKTQNHVLSAQYSLFQIIFHCTLSLLA